MFLIIVKDSNELSLRAARYLSDFIAQNPTGNLCLPTGSTVLGTYRALCSIIKDEGIAVQNIRFYSMDDYIPLAEDDPNSFYYFLREHVYQNLGVSRAQTFRPNADAPDPAKASEEYTALVAGNGGFDFTFLGVGTDGHIAFNMPAPMLHLDTHIENLSEEARQSNAKFFKTGEVVPSQAVSIGIGMILSSKRLLLAASGTSKAEVMRLLLTRRVYDPKLPVSCLWLHKDVTLILDEEAASGLERSTIERMM